jgi:multidrug efflux pump subunit AcrB
LLLLVKVLSPDRSRDNLYLGNYANLQVKGELQRLPGVADVVLFGHWEEGIRLWLNPEPLAAHGLTADGVVRALEAQNVRVEGRGGPPEAPLSLPSPAGLRDLERLEGLVVKATPDGRTVRLKDVARFELGDGAGSGAALLDDEPVVLLGVCPSLQAQPGEVSAAVEEALGRLRVGLPRGVDVGVALDFTANLEDPGRATTPEYLLLDLALPPEASRERTLAALEACRAALKAVEGVQGTVTLTDHPFDRIRDRPCLLVRLQPPAEREASREEIIQALRARVGEVKGVTLRVRDLSRPGGLARCRYPIELALEDRGDLGPGRLHELATRLAARLRESGRLADVWVNPDSAPRPQLSLTVDRDKATAQGVAVGDIFAALQALAGVARVNDFNRFGRVWQLGLPPGGRLRAEDLRELTVRNARGQRVPLAELVQIREAQGGEAVTRHNQYRTVEITANLALGTSLGQARALCEAQAEQLRRELQLGNGYQLAWLQEMPAPE